jgi:molecular chaperone GrpE
MHPVTGVTRAPDPKEEVAVTDSAIGGVPTSGTDVAGDDDRSSTDGVTVPENGSSDDTVIEGVLEDAPGDAAPSTDAGPADAAAAGEAGELDRVKRDLEERTADLQRVSAEYANYRRRVERDRDATVAGAKASVASELLTVLDDVERAASHGDLTGPFKVVADRLTETLQKVGLEPFGAEGDAFDPAVHEAVAQETSAEVSGPTVTTVMRRGYRFGDRVLRPAMVAVTDHDPSASS